MIQSMTRLIATAAIGLTLAASATAESVVVVVNPKSSVTSLTADQVASSAWARPISWSSAGRGVDLPEASASRESTSWQGHWQDDPSGQGHLVPPDVLWQGHATKELGSSADVKKLSPSNPDAIGYIEKSAPTAVSKAVLTLTERGVRGWRGPSSCSKEPCDLLLDRS